MLIFVVLFADMSGCDASLTDVNFQCPNHQQENTTHHLPLALRSLPPEVELCASSIPGAGFGICAKRAFPVGAWIGPYEGTFVKPEELSSVKDTSYMWEVSVVHRLVYKFVARRQLCSYHTSTGIQTVEAKTCGNWHQMHKVINSRLLTVLLIGTLLRTHIC